MPKLQTTFEKLDDLANSGEWIQRLAQRLVGDPNLAEDVVQETYLAALSARERPRNSLQAWLSGVVHNVASSRMREEARRRKREQLVARDESTDSTLDKVARLEQQELLIRALVSLPDPFREALILRYVDGLAPRLIAAKLRAPIATVNSRLARGLERLRVELDATHGGDRSRWLSAFAPLCFPTLNGTSLKAGTLLMKTKTTVVAATLALALTGLYFGGEAFFSNSQESPSRESDVELSLPLEGSGIVEAPIAKVSLPAKTLESGRVPVAIEADAPAPAIEITPWPDTGVDIELVMADTGLPAANAIVRHIPNQQKIPAHLITSLFAWYENMEPQELEGVPVYQADEAGHVRVPDSAESTFLIAELDDLRGYLALKSEYGGEHRIELAHPLNLTFRVENTRGDPVPFCPITYDDSMYEWLIQWSETDSNGERILYNANTLFAPVRTAYSGALTSTIQVTATCWGKTFTKDIDLDDIPTKPVVFIVPAGGTVVVQVEAAEGQELPNQTLPIELTVMAKKTVLSNSGSRGEGHSITFHNVPSGVQVSADLQRHFAGQGSLATGLVPEPGEPPLRLVITLDNDSGEIAMGTLVDPEHQPMPEAGIYYTVRQSTGGDEKETSRKWTRADSKGVFRLNLSELNLVLDDPAAVTEIELQVRRSRDRERTLYCTLPALSGELNLPLRLGEVMVAQLPRIAAGRVVDTHGNPLAGALVEVSYLDESKRFSKHTIYSWDYKELPHTDGKNSQPDGSFVVRGVTDKEQLFITADLDGFKATRRQAMSHGSDGLVLELEQSGSLMGSLSTAPGQSASSFVIGIHPKDAGTREEFVPDGLVGGFSTDKSWWDSSLLANGEFGWRNLSPGLYDVRIFLAGQDMQFSRDRKRIPLRVWENVLVESGSTCRDPRLQNVDLSSAIQLRTVTVMDTKGALIHDVVGVLLDKKSQSIGDFKLENGTGVVTSTSTPAQVLLGAQGYLAALQDDVPYDLNVTLKPTFQVTLVLPDGLELPERVSLSGGLEFVGPGDGRIPFSTGLHGSPFGKGEAQVTCPGLGPNRLRVLVRREVGDSWRGTWINFPRGESEVQITADSAGAIFEVRVTQAMLDEALER